MRVHALLFALVLAPVFAPVFARTAFASQETNAVRSPLEEGGVVGIGGGGARWIARRKAWRAFRQAGGERLETFDAGLRWLGEEQRDDGGFEPEVQGRDPSADGAARDVRATGLALLVFTGLGGTVRDGEGRDLVKLGTHWLVARTDPQSGALLTARGEPVGLADQAIATLALCELWDGSRSPILRRSADLAVARLARASLVPDAFRSGEPATVLDIDRCAWTAWARW